MPKQTKPSSKQVWNTLKKSLFDPRNPGPMAVILETGTPLYLEQRALELVRTLTGPQTTKFLREQHLKNLQMAISLLTMSQILREADDAPVQKPKEKTKPLVERADPNFKMETP